MENANLDRKFRAGDAARLLGIPSARVAQMGQYLIPDNEANGKGHHFEYSFRNLVEMRLQEELGRFGVPQKRIQKYIEDLRASKWQWLDYNGQDGIVILDSVYRWAAGSTVEEALKNLSHTMTVTSFIAVDVGLIKQAIRTRMEETGEIQALEQ